MHRDSIRDFEASDWVNLILSLTSRRFISPIIVQSVSFFRDHKCCGDEETNDWVAADGDTRTLAAHTPTTPAPSQHTPPPTPINSDADCSTF